MDEFNSRFDDDHFITDPDDSPNQRREVSELGISNSPIAIPEAKLADTCSEHVQPVRQHYEHPIDSIIITIQNMVPIVDRPCTNSQTNEKIVIPPTVCAHPIHLHSLTRLTNLSTILRSRFSICSVCSERISIVAGDIVTCLACSIFIHRKCAQKKELQVCEVNRDLLMERHGLVERMNPMQPPSRNENVCDDTLQASNTRIASEENLNESESTGIAQTPVSQKKNTTDRNLSFEQASETFNIVDSCSMESDSSDDYVWSDNGPPAHWALSPNGPTFLKGIKSHSESRSDLKSEELDNIDEKNSGKEQDNDWKSSLANLSVVIQRHVFANQEANENKEDGEATTLCEQENSISTNVVHFGDIPSASSDDKDAMNHSKAVVQSVSRTIQSTDSISNDAASINDQEDLSAVLEEAPPSPLPPTKTQGIIHGTVDAVKNFQQTRKNIGVVSIAGGITGATAGLIVGGPAGAYVGSQLGRVVGAGVWAGVAVINTIGVGTLVGVTGSILTVKSLSEANNNRMVTIGGEGSEKVVLVRPNVVVDPIWEEITIRTRRSAPRDNIMNGFALFGDKKNNRDERNRRAKDIAYSGEEEISTQEKVFLLVTNSLNDKESLPGYVYRELMKEAKDRNDRRKESLLEKESSRGIGKVKRALRQDTHGIIKYITATLLEVRPGFSSSPRITAMSALAVETIVFGELYNDVFDEIINDPVVYEKDQELDSKCSRLKAEANAAGIDMHQRISDEALLSIQRLPQFHSVQEKLKCCVELLEHVSRLGAEASMGADFLLTLVCQHLAIANVPKLNAECSFLEEFATDDQLLQGKEGYALVTIQACVHFLNASQNLVEDVFQHDDDM